MPDTDIDIINETIGNLKEYSSENRIRSYEILEKGLIDGVKISHAHVNEILNIIVEDIKYATPTSLNIILKILERIKNGELPYTEELTTLLPSAVANLNVINSTVMFTGRLEILREKCLENLLLFPEETLRKLAMFHRNKVMEFYESSKFYKISIEFKVMYLQFTLKILRALPQKERHDFVEKEVTVWLSKGIPTVVVYLNQVSGTSAVKCIEFLEVVTTELLAINYVSDPYWETVFQNISNPNKYPLIMKKLLESGSSLWHRLWIVCIKLLDHQVTRNNSGLGTPINSMLPVVEAAFKIDAKNRCRAFECWTVLIDIFAKETNDNCINKRLKLLVIPLRLNNAKVEETAISKFGAWWHLIMKFSTRLGMFTDLVLISFLHFCFGKHNASKPTFVPGQICDKLSMKCIEGFIEIVGHVACEGCTNLPRLKERLLCKKYLIEYWNDWSHSMETAINLLIKKGGENSQKQISCIWKSFLLTVGDLPDNSIRKDLITELLKILEHFVEEGKSNSQNAEVVFNSLIITLFDEETKIKQLLKSQIEDDGVLHNVIRLLVDPLFNSVYKYNNTSAIIGKLKPIANFIIAESLNSETHILKWILDNLPSNDNTLKFWTALAELLSESGFSICVNSLCYMLIWPLKSMNQFNDIKYSAKTWVMLYNVMLTKLMKTDIHELISNILLHSTVVTHTSTYMALSALLSILRNGVKKHADDKYEKQVELLQVLINRIDNYEDIEDIFPVLVDTIVVICNVLSETKNEVLEEHTMMCVKKTMILVYPVLKDKDSAQNTRQILIENLLKSVYSVLKTTLHPKSYNILSDILNLYATNFKDRASLYESIDFILKLNSSQDKENSPHDINNDLEICEKPSQISNEKTKKFSTPNTKEVSKKKKKETSIVNTVVENGEEFVVVKSNWKFNPKKLTENQKEKFTRKREDIPALYQDLSQSQDEFKMTKWKTDSQDSSTTSKSTSVSVNNSNTGINLKEMPGTDVVPNIIENILADKTVAVSEPSSETSPKVVVNTNKDKKSETPKPRTPRMALKDRVFRNVRNLIEKSTTKTPEKEINTTEARNSESLVKTPVSKEVHTENGVNSAPPMLLADRPSRVKRLPKKFDGAELFAMKKRCQSQTDLSSNDQVVEKSKTNTQSLTKKSVLPEPENIKVVENKVPDEPMIVDNIDIPTVINDDNNKKEQIVIKEIEPTISAEAPTITQEKNTDIVSKQIEASKNVEVIENTNSEIVNSALSSQESINEETSTIVTHVVQVHSTEDSTPKSKENSIKKSTKKKSRIEKELAIDMVEGHPFLNTPTTTQKRSTRKSLATPNTKRTSLSEKINKTKNTKKKDSLETKQTDPALEKDDVETNSDSQTDQSQSCSEDVIESSQDSTITTISISTKTPKKIPIVALKKINVVSNKNDNISETQNLLKDQDVEMFEDSEEKANLNKNVENHEKSSDKADSPKDKLTAKPISPSPVEVSQSIIFINETSSCNENKDLELSVNKTAEETNVESTESMDTEPLANIDESDVILINDDEPPIVVSSEEKTVEIESQQLAEADTQPIDQNEKLNSILNIEESTADEIIVNNESVIATQDDVTKTLTESMDVSEAVETNDVSSPYKNDEQRKKDFLNNTIEISPIKTLSPDREDKSPSPETSSDYVVIKLTSPVHSNGEPFEKGSPEFFTEEKVSPDKRDQSPPRTETVVVNTSPSSLQSLKKNKPQVRTGGRAAQMLGLCVPDKLNSMMKDKSDYEENKKSSPMTTPARRNLRMLYNSVTDSSETGNESEDSESFLKFKRTLPALDVSPSVPILKRKLAEISDDTTVSPATKRKRVSFHDPPVSTTVSVQKYIEPLGLRSPQNSAQKRQERQTRSSSNYKSQKRLDHAFKLDTALSKAVESFTDVEILSNSDTTPGIGTPPEGISNPTEIIGGIQPLKSIEANTEKLPTITNTDSDIVSKDDTLTSLEQTPVVEVVNISELNDKDPICAELLDCNDPIDNVAADLSSTAMKSLLIKELQGKITTIGDLAKLTELEVNRLCIKAPKVKTVKKVLGDYATKVASMKTLVENPKAIDEPLQVFMDVETQTTTILNDAEVQTSNAMTSSSSMQTETAVTSHAAVQTKESGYKSTTDVIASCLKERFDFVEQLSNQLDVPAIQTLSEKMSTSDLISTLNTKITDENTHDVLNKVLDHSSDKNKIKELAILGDYICKKFDSKDLVLFCSEMLRKVYDKPN